MPGIPSTANFDMIHIGCDGRTGRMNDRNPEIVFKGEIDPVYRQHTVVVVTNGKAVPLDPMLNVKNSSPTGFAWGYGGSGPAQLAFAMLAHLLSVDAALQLHQAFKWEVIAKLEEDQPWTMSASEVLDWVRKHDEER